MLLLSSMEKISGKHPTGLSAVIRSNTVLCESV